ncbi:Rv3654c family TadE-like protein [Streptomyces sp. NPDC003781]|uniref:Rv3654c family TadE-like protein n=1 Tax=Streptomyces sp. NPDC003781 TaxID=3364686 RepID=UPI0036AD40B3
MRGGAPPRPEADRCGTGAGGGPGPADGRDRAAASPGLHAVSDRGSATVWSVVVIAVLCVVFGVVLALGQAVMARHRAAGGADLAALAAADHWAHGGTAACERASRVARAQRVRLVRCVITGQVSDVTAASGRGPFTAEVRARAGPAPLTSPAQTPAPAQEPAPAPPPPAPSVPSSPSVASPAPVPSRPPSASSPPLSSARPTGPPPPPAAAP